MNIFIHCIIIIEAVLSPTSAAVVIVYVYGKVGDNITLPNAETYKGLYVTWHSGIPEEKVLLLQRHKFGSDLFTDDEHWKGRLSLSETNCSLIIKAIKPEDFQPFTCVLKDKERDVSITTYELYEVRVSPGVSEGVPLLLAGESLSLSCTVQTPAGGPQPQIHWLGPKEESVATNRRTQGGNLTVEGVTGRDHGEWTCVLLRNGIESRTKTSVIVVDLSPGHSYPYYLSSSPLQINCSIPLYLTWEHLMKTGLQGGYWNFTPSFPSRAPQKLHSLLAPGKSSTWTTLEHKGAGSMNTLDLVKKNLFPSSEPASEADRGEYTCALEFKGGVTLQRSVRVEVLQIISSPASGLMSGQQVNLSCSLGHNLISNLEVKWIPPSSQSSFSHPRFSPHPAHLTIPNLAVVGDQARWRCELWQNKSKLTSAEITLKIESSGPMSVWLLVTLCASAVILILLPFSVFLIRRQRQLKTRRKRRNHKHRFCRCENPKPKGFYRT